MNLNQILKKISRNYQVFGNLQNLEHAEFDDISIDSRKINKNTIFFGLIGQKNDGANFLPDVANLGSKLAVISQKSTFDFQNFLKKYPQNIIIIGDVFEILTDFLKIFYQPLPKNIYAITGTNGKTSTAEFTRQILNFLHKKSASIGTIGINCDEEIKHNFEVSNLTTPDIISLYKNLAILKKLAIDDVAIEVSSIGLDQRRMAGLEIDVGAFTNFTQDHLDYHHNMQNYFDCKMILFEKILSKNGCAVINSDIKEFGEIKKICQKNQLKIIDYGFEAQALKLVKIENQKVDFLYNQQQFSFATNINGDFQIFNILCALGNILAKYNLSNHEIAELIKNFDNLQCASGRMQKVCEHLGAKIFIDFAHSPDAIENILKLAKKMAKNRVIILFGCGGDRDAKKRPIMGEIACKNADLVIVSDDNPRNENPALIRQEILQKCDASKTLEIADRKIAIAKAIEILQNGDVLIIAGKGHENYQIIGSQKFEFNESQIIKNAIKKIS
jgi:UDP-N-acetylmuramoyl-L-alanyl-D-glutamate--2,6-diaminopimelate ligase